MNVSTGSRLQPTTGGLNRCGYGSKLNQGTAGFSPGLHLPGPPFGVLFLDQPCEALGCCNARGLGRRRPDAGRQDHPPASGPGPKVTRSRRIEGVPLDAVVEGILALHEASSFGAYICIYIYIHIHAHIYIYIYK